jgi:hypothetical protein
VAYTNRTIRLDFSGGDDNYPALGDDIFVTIANPMLMPPSKLRPKVDVELDADGSPKDANEAVNASLEIVAGLILDWCIYDPMDFSENPEPIPLPATAEIMNMLPLAVTNAVTEILGKALNPR